MKFAPGRRLLQIVEATAPGHSGLLYAVHFLAGRLLSEGHEVIVVAPACDGPNPYRDDPGRTEIRLPAMHIPGVPSAIARGQGFEKVIERFKADPPDVIHVHGLGSVGMLGVWTADQAEVPPPRLTFRRAVWLELAPWRKFTP